MLVQLIASRLIWPQAVICCNFAMNGGSCPSFSSHSFPWCSSIFFVIRVGRFDHGETVKYLDQAESWLGWKGPFVRALSLGLVNPRKMVDNEVKKSLSEMQSTLTASLWWVAADTLRLAFGLTLWTAFGRSRMMIHPSGVVS